MVQRKDRHYFVLGVTFLCVSVILFFGGMVVRQWSARDWFGAEPYRILVLHGKQGTSPSSIEMISVWPGLQKASSLTLPSDLMISTVGGYGNYRLSALVELGRVEGVGDRLVQDSVGFTLGVPLHLVLWQQGTSFDVWGARRQLLSEGLSGKKSLPEVFSLFPLFSLIKPSSMEQLSLSQENVIRETKEADGSSILVVERPLLLRFMLDHFSSQWKEAALTQVSIINATNKPQIASTWSTYALVGGYDVVSVTDRQESEEKTRIIFSSRELSMTTASKALIHLYQNSTVEVGDTSEYRSQVAIILGLDNWRYLTDRTAYLSTLK